MPCRRVVKENGRLSCSREVIAGSGGSQYPPGTNALALTFRESAVAAAAAAAASPLLAAAAVVLGGVDDPS